MARKKALVIGGLGVIGRRLITHLSATNEWDIVSVSRRKPDFETRAEFISVDLFDRDATKAKLGHLSDVTHIFYAALDGGIQASNVERNLALLVNPVEVVEPVAKDLQRIVLAEGGKWYGRHLGRFKTPAKEDDPRSMPPNFYYDQEDFLRERQKGRSWTWTGLRPEAVLGFAIGNPMNLLLLIGVYAAICKELGLPLRFPGRPGAYTGLNQVTDSALLAKAQTWAATDPRCANESFNITNGDGYRWENIWPRFGQFFDMDIARPQQLSLTEIMADKGPVWDRVVKKHGLKPHRYEDVAAWPFGDFILHTDWDVFLDDSKRYRYGFTETVDTDARMLELLGQFRAERVIP
jgi:nucleoside-diphosphate-sugar epimerase